MSEKKIIRVRRISPGVAEGIALVSKSPLSFHGLSMIFETGTVRWPKGHELEGQSVKERVVLFPTASGSTGGSWSLYTLKIYGTAPKAIIVSLADPVTTAGAILCEIPMVEALDENPYQYIETGDHVRVDANSGVLEVFKEK